MLLVLLLFSIVEDAEGSVVVTVLTEPTQQTVRTLPYFEDKNNIGDSDNDNGAISCNFWRFVLITTTMTPSGQPACTYTDVLQFSKGNYEG